MSNRRILPGSRSRIRNSQHHQLTLCLVLETLAPVLLLLLCVNYCHSFSILTIDKFYGDDEGRDPSVGVGVGEDANLLESPEMIQAMIEMILNGTGMRSTRQEQDLTLITFLQTAVKNYGQKKVAKSIYELAQKNMYDLMWMLAGELDTFLIFDLYSAYAASQSDPEVLSVYERFRAGNVNRTIVPEVFALDKKYDQFSWYSRVRGRMLNSVNKYLAGKLDLNGGKTPPPIEYDKDGKVIIAGVRIPDSSTDSSGVARQTTTKESFVYEVDSDEDNLLLEEFLNAD